MRTMKVAIAAAIAAVGLCAVLGALQSVIWNGFDAPALARFIASVLDAALLVEPASSTLPQPTESYFGYGRLVVGLYALLIVCADALRRQLRARAGAAVTGLLTIAAVADVAAYWMSESQGPALRRVAFWYTEVPALVATVVVLTGIGVVRLRQGKRFGALALGLPLAVTTTAVLGYLPHGLLLGIALTFTLAFTGTLVFTGATPDDNVLIKPRGRRRLALGVAAVVLVSGGLGVQYRPTLRPGPAVTLRPMTVTEGLEGARLHVFNTGFNRMSKFLVGRDRPWRPVPAFVIEDPQHGLFVFDTGLSSAVADLGEAGVHAPERWVLESRSSRDQMLPAQMRAAGLDPLAVHHVALSHLHGDHVGQLDAFPNAQLVVGTGAKGSLEKLVRGDLVGTRIREQRFDPAVPFGPFDQVIDVVGDQSIVIVRGGGHAHEGLMVLLALDAGPVLLTGDAVVHADWLNSNDVQRIVVDKDRAATVRNQVRRFRADVPRAAIAYGHDLRDLDCTRPDIVCHRPESFYPETHALPDSCTAPQTESNASAVH